jgi:hypothetical protein
MTSGRTRYAGYRFPVEIISHAVWGTVDLSHRVSWRYQQGEFEFIANPHCRFQPRSGSCGS